MLSLLTRQYYLLLVVKHVEPRHVNIIDLLGLLTTRLSRRELQTPNTSHAEAILTLFSPCDDQFCCGQRSRSGCGFRYARLNHVGPHWARRKTIDISTKATCSEETCWVSWHVNTSYFSYKRHVGTIDTSTISTSDPFYSQCDDQSCSGQRRRSGWVQMCTTETCWTLGQEKHDSRADLSSFCRLR